MRLETHRLCNHRQDKAILAVFDDLQCYNVDPDWNKTTDPSDSVFQSLVLRSNAVLASIGHAPLALLMARRRRLLNMTQATYKN